MTIMTNTMEHLAATAKSLTATISAAPKAAAIAKEKATIFASITQSTKGAWLTRLCAAVATSLLLLNVSGCGAKAKPFDFVVAIEGEGRISSANGDIDCHGDGTIDTTNNSTNTGNCRKHYEKDMALTLTATPANGYVFSGWQVAACAANANASKNAATNSSASSNCTLSNADIEASIVNGVYTLKAVFKPVQTTNNGATYTYNAQGQRNSKTVAGVTTYYIYDLQGKLLQELNDNGEAATEYIHFNNENIAQIRKQSDQTQAQMFYVHNDHLATPVLITDQSQKVAWEHDTTPFGQVYAQPGTQAVEQNLRFPGQYADAESGLSYNYFRDYDPSLGRYLQSDPIGLNGGINTYAYVSGNPISRVDPYGLLETCWETPTGYACRDDGRRFCPDGSCAAYPASANTQKPEPVDPVKCRAVNGRVVCRPNPGDSDRSCEKIAENALNQCIDETVFGWQLMCGALYATGGRAAVLFGETAGVVGATGGGLIGPLLCPGLNDVRNSCKVAQANTKVNCDCTARF